MFRSWKFSNCLLSRILKERKGLFLFASAALFLLLFFLYLSHEIVESKNELDSWSTLDRGILDSIVKRRNHELTTFWVSITYLGSSTSLFVFSFVGLLFAHFKSLWSDRFVLATSTIATVIAIPFSKAMIGRPRPAAELWLVPVDSLSFPSGHSLAITAILGSIFYLLGRACPLPVQSLIVWLAGLIGISLVGFSRIYLGVHYPSDVLGGFLLGASILFFAIGLDSLVVGHKNNPLG